MRTGIDFTLGKKFGNMMKEWHIIKKETEVNFYLGENRGFGIIILKLERKKEVK